MKCKYFHSVNTITVGSSIVLGFTTSPTVKDETRFCFRIYDAIPTGSDALPVFLNVNGVSVQVWNKYGVQMTGAELRKCKIYKGWFTTQGSVTHVIVFNEPMECGV